MTPLEKRLAAWHRRKFGPGGVLVEVTLVKAMEEMGELARAILAGDTGNAREEAADIAIVLVHLVRGLGGSLHDEMEKKAAVIDRRLVHGR